MTHSRALRPLPQQAGAQAVADLLEAAIGDLQTRLASAGPGKLISARVKLPAWACPCRAGWGGDSRWLAPKDGVLLYGSGEAVRLDNADGERFRAECRDWEVHGDEGAAPLFFFTAPPATQPKGFTLWLPRVLARCAPDHATVILSLRRDATPIPQVIDGWRTEIRSLFSTRASITARRPVRRMIQAPGLRQWDDRVRAAIAAIGRGEFSKVVLARRLHTSMADGIDIDDLVARLSAAYPECCVFSLPHGGGRVVAASPERLAIKRGSQVVSHALAGTAGCGSTADEAAGAAAALLSSLKERREHAVVVDAITAGLAEICDTVAHAREPAVMRLRRLQHLWTPVSGHLREGFGLLDVVGRLHPTPAVVGFPRQAATAWLRQTEETRDGLYTGVAGWIDRDGDGDAAVVLRSAHIDGRSATLWAGAGIMAESDPAAELAETELKLSTMLDLLGGP